MRRTGVALLLVVAGCGRQADAPPAAPPAVRFAQVGALRAASLVEAPGTVAWRRETQLGFTSPGRIARLPVEEGQDVGGGQLLAALDATTVGSALASAEAERVRAAAEYRRSSTLLQQGWVTRPRVDNAQAALAAAEANVRAARFQSSNATIVAPGPGTVLRRIAEPGQVVTAGTPVLVFGEAGSGRVLRVPLSERDVRRIGAGAPATVRFADGTSVGGSVTEIGGLADPATGTIAVEVALPNDPRLRSGMVATASIRASGDGGQAPLVNGSAVFSARAGEGFVWVLDERARAVRLRKVAVAETGDAGIRVTGGLRPGEWVAVTTVDRLRDGQKVTPQRLPR